MLAQGRTVLTESEAKAVLAEFHIPVNLTRLAKSADEAVRLAGEIGYPVVLKIESYDILHKTDVGGVVLNLIRKPRCARPMSISGTVRDRRPDARACRESRCSDDPSLQCARADGRRGARQGVYPLISFRYRRRGGGKSSATVRYRCRR